MAPRLGLILTYAPDLPAVRSALATARAEALKVVPAWGLGTGWSPAAIAEAAYLAPTVIVRTSWGDPSARLVDNEDRSYPFADRIYDELLPWLVARDDLVVEIGNEPRQAATPPDPHRYASHLNATITRLHSVFPRARLLAPAHSLNNPTEDAEVARWLTICAAAYRRCNGIALHAYSREQARRGLSLLATHIGALPVWLTEFGLHEAVPDDERGRRYWDVIADLPVEAALVYHLDQSGGAATAEQGPALYRLAPATLAALGRRGEAEGPPLGGALQPDTVAYRERIDDFVMDVRQWRTVPAFRRHLAQYSARQVAPWATGVTLHHTVSPLPSTWRGLQSILSIATFYRDDPRYRWDRGPHLFSVSGAPDPAHDGIWQMTPLNLPGIHGNTCNSTRWGLEVVGSFDSQRWDAGTAALALGGLAALHDWAGWPAVTVATLNGHRECRGVDPTKTCPGKAIDLATVRRGVAALRGAV